MENPSRRGRRTSTKATWGRWLRISDSVASPSSVTPDTLNPEYDSIARTIPLR